MASTRFVPILVEAEQPQGDVRPHAFLPQAKVRIPVDVLGSALREVTQALGEMLDSAQPSGEYLLDTAEITVAINQDGSIGLPNIASARLGTSSQLKLVFRRRPPSAAG
jgi:hypothetical protein